MDGHGTVCVIFNPAAARGRAAAGLEAARGLLGPAAVFRATRGPGDAEALAAAAAGEGFATVVAAGGDGTVHEVANGLLTATRQEVAFGVLPLGSGNDYAAALEVPPLADLCRDLVAGPVRRVDVGRVNTPSGPARFFVNTAGVGLSGAVTWEARRIGRLRGLALYGLAAVRAIARHSRAPEGRLTVDGRAWATSTLYLSVAVGKREGGGFVVAPQAELDDGLLDYLHAARLSRLKALSYLPRLALGWLPDDDPVIRRGRCTRLDLELDEPVFVHLDGELYPRPGERVGRLGIELLAGSLPVRGSRPARG